MHNLMLRPFVTGSVLAAALVGLILSCWTAKPAALAQDEKPRVSIELPATTVKEGGDAFDVNIVVDKAKNLASFQFSLSYDNSILKYEGVQPGPFLGGSGREAQCTDPRVNEGSPSSISFGCVTLGPPVSMGGPAGPDGFGLLATIRFSPVGGGVTPLELLEGRLLQAEINEEGRPIEVETEVSSGSLEVQSSGGGISWALWGAVIGVAALVLVIGGTVAAMRLRAPRGLGRIGQ